MTSANNPTGLSASANIFDVGSLATLKRQAKAGDAAANKQVAQQFEALFLQMVLKSMREATPREGLFDSEQTRMYESLLDQQLGQSLVGSRRGLGLAAIIEAQLARQNQEAQVLDAPLPLHRETPSYPLSVDKTRSLPANTFPPSIPLQNRAPGLSGAVAPEPSVAAEAASSTQRAFVARLLPAALATERSTGILAQFVVAQAALETGWGKSEPRRADGSPSFNVFGIKAGRAWQGAVAEATTTEYVDGVAQKQVERFRAYASYEEAVNDYARLLATNPRYAAVLGAQEPGSFARALQAAGFATDPQYAAKLERIIGGTTLRQALAG